MKTFKRSGDIGDIIYSMPTIRALGGGVVYLNPGKKLKSPINGIPTKRFTSEVPINLLRPLLESQDYIHGVRVWDYEDVDYDLDQFRNRGMRFSKTNLAAAHLHIFNLDTELINDRWLFNIGTITIQNKSVVIHRSPRYHNPNFEKNEWPRYLDEHRGDILFVGIPSEYDDFVRRFGCSDIPFHQVKDLLELAEMINGSKLFIGNQSAPFAIAEGLHANSILERCPVNWNCDFKRRECPIPKFVEFEVPPKPKPTNNSTKKYPMIHTHVTYAPHHTNKNIGQAYNDFVEMVPDDDWICFLDHDAMFTTDDWYKQLEEIAGMIESKPELQKQIGLLTVLTNRIGNVEQIIFRKDSEEAKNHDMYFHRRWGKSQQKFHRGSLQKATNLISGIVMLFPKRVWLKTSGFKDGFLGVDNDFDKQVRELGYGTYIMKGIYCYHWYRAAPKPGELQGWGYPVSNNLPPIK